MTRRASLYDEDGIDGPFEREMSKPIVFDAARAEATVDALSAALELRRNVQRAIGFGDRPPVTTIGTTEAPSVVESPFIAYSRRQHAAHYGPGAGGHDLERWDVTQPYAAARPDSVPSDTEKHSGYIDRSGAAHTLFVRRAPLSGPPCPLCASRGVR